MTDAPNQQPNGPNQWPAGQQPPSVQPRYEAPPAGAYQQPQQPPYPGHNGYAQQSPYPSQQQPGYQQYPAQPQQYMQAPPGPGGAFDGAVHPKQLDRPLYGANPVQAVSRFFKNYANFSGRASRSEYWWVALFYFVAFIVLGITAAIVQEASYSYGYYSGFGASDALGIFFGLVFFVLLIGSIVPSLALGWRRLHDANLAGPLYLLNLVPYIGGFVVLVFSLLPPRPEGRRFDRVMR